VDVVPGLAGGSDRVGTRSHGLRLQRLERPIRRHLTRDDRVEIPLQPDDVDDVESAAVVEDPEVAAIAKAVYSQEALARGGSRRTCELPLADHAHLAVARRDDLPVHQPSQRLVADLEVFGRAESHR
jgi:hypothetical protein